MNTRLTAENATKEKLDELALETAGLLGTYKEEEYQALVALDRDDWGFEWLPFNMDTSTGRVKMKPLSPKSTKLLDKGRAYRLMKRHPKMQLSFAVSFTKVTKRVAGGMNSRVQDFLLAHWRDADIPAMMKDREIFGVWARKKAGRQTLTDKQINVIYELMPKVLRTMPKARSKKAKSTNAE
jgi:hypothetical protein